MKKAKSTVAVEEEVTKPSEITEESQTTENTETTTEEPKGLSRRDALEVALLGTKEETDETPVVAEESEPKTDPDSEPKASPKYQPPAEWDADDKKLFYESSPAHQEAALKLHSKRQSKLEGIRREVEELKSLRSLSDSISPYLKAVGVEVPTDVALKRALTMWREFEEGDPLEAAAAYLDAKGNGNAATSLRSSKQSTNNAVDPRLDPLTKEVEAIKLKIAKEETQQRAGNLLEIWRDFTGSTNAAGKPKYPVDWDSEAGNKLAGQIGTLVRGDTELSKQYIASVAARIPDLTQSRLLEEAYRFYGGQVDESAEAPRSQTSQSHIAKSSRAAASVPGRGAVATSSGPAKKLSRREALAAALAEIREREGA